MEDIHIKVLSFAHVEFNHPEYITKEHIHHCIQEGKELFGRDISDKVTPDMLLPADFQGLPDGWEEFQRDLKNLQRLDTLP